MRRIPFSELRREEAALTYLAAVDLVPVYRVGGHAPGGRKHSALLLFEEGAYEFEWDGGRERVEQGGLIYLPDGSVLPAGQNAAALSAGVECLILTVSDWVEPGFNRYDTFEVGVSRTAPVGDVNGDGRTDTDDALALLRWLSESEDAALQNPDAADCNADGFIDMLDVQTILRISKES